MPLIPCRECGCEISSYADKCPHCGAPVLKDNEMVFKVSLDFEEFDMDETPEQAEERMRREFDEKFKNVKPLNIMTGEELLQEIKKKK